MRRFAVNPCGHSGRFSLRYRTNTSGEIVALATERSSRADSRGRTVRADRAGGSRGRIARADRAVPRLWAPGKPHPVWQAFPTGGSCSMVLMAAEYSSVLETGLPN
ncbi:MAG: hypothetical protein JNL67_01785 [Planctomycetaceae bacterium]|nr:hypothetical protein [Planctomycetaceae bacterium]